MTIEGTVPASLVPATRMGSEEVIQVPYDEVYCADCGLGYGGSDTDSLWTWRCLLQWLHLGKAFGGYLTTLNTNLELIGL